MHLPKELETGWRWLRWARRLKFAARILVALAPVFAHFAGTKSSDLYCPRADKPLNGEESAPDAFLSLDRGKGVLERPDVQRWRHIRTNHNHKDLWWGCFWPPFLLTMAGGMAGWLAILLCFPKTAMNYAYLLLVLAFYVVTGSLTFVLYVFRYG